jgi:hypothetical protein
MNGLVTLPDDDDDNDEESERKPLIEKSKLGHVLL